MESQPRSVPLGDGKTALVIHGLAILVFTATFSAEHLQLANSEIGFTFYGFGLAAIATLYLWSIVLAFRSKTADGRRPKLLNAMLWLALGEATLFSLSPLSLLMTGQEPGQIGRMIVYLSFPILVPLAAILILVVKLSRWCASKWTARITKHNPNTSSSFSIKFRSIFYYLSWAPTLLILAFIPVPLLIFSCLTYDLGPLQPIILSFTPEPYRTLSCNFLLQINFGEITTSSAILFGNPSKEFLQQHMIDPQYAYAILRAYEDRWPEDIAIQAAKLLNKELHIDPSLGETLAETLGEHATPKLIRSIFTESYSDNFKIYFDSVLSR